MILLGHDLIPHHHGETSHEQEEAHRHSGLADFYAHFQHTDDGIIYLGARYTTPASILLSAVLPVETIAPFPAEIPVSTLAMELRPPPELGGYLFCFSLRGPPAFS